MADDLTDRVVALADEAARTAPGPDEGPSGGLAAGFAEVAERLRGPLRLAFAGKVKAGKSTLLNAVIGEELAPTDAGECTRIVTWYRYSDRPYARLFPRQGEPVERPYTRQEGALEVDLGGRDAESVDHLEIGWPSRRLASLVLIDTPGIASLSTDVSARTHRALVADDGHAAVADAVLYLLRHTHGADLRFLESFHDDEVAHGTPVNTVGVLSRADELGSSRLDAMEVADRVARRYEAEPRLRRLCPLVVPVNGLLGHAAATLREAEFGVLSTIARAPVTDIADLLLTAERFAHADSTIPVPAERRALLLDRLGLYGVRLGVDLVRTGAARTSSDLATRLADVSGLDRLRAVVLRQFESRARVLKARSAVAALRDLLQRWGGDDADRLARRLEEITSGAHEFEEVRVLLELRAGRIALAAEREAKLDLLMGGSGHDPAVRLGLEAGASAEQMREAGFAALETWQSVERHPLSSRATQIAARAAARSVEGLLMQLREDA